MGKLIGPATEFYRLRLTHFDEGGDVEFDWRDDVLWRSTEHAPGEESDVWVLEAVTLDAEESVAPICACATSVEAHETLADVERDLAVMTKSEFEATYIDRCGEEPELEFEP